MLVGAAELKRNWTEFIDRKVIQSIWKYIASVEYFDVDWYFFKVNGVLVKEICEDESVKLELNVANTSAECSRGLRNDWNLKLSKFALMLFKRIGK